jgi:hypothetical protein
MKNMSQNGDKYRVKVLMPSQSKGNHCRELEISLFR